MNMTRRVLPVLLLTCLGGLGMGCLDRIMSRVMEQADSAMDEGARSRGYEYNASLVSYVPRGSGWFATSAESAVVEAGVREGMSRVAKEKSYFHFVDKVQRSESDGFFARLSELKDEDSRKDFVRQFCKSHGTDMLVFGTYSGNDKEMYLRNYAYYERTHKIWVDPADKKYSKDMPDTERQKQISQSIRDFIVNTMDQ